MVEEGSFGHLLVSTTTFLNAAAEKNPLLE